MTREGSEAEPSRKRASQSSRQANTPDPVEVVDAANQALELWSQFRESSQGPSSFSWTKEGFKLPETRRDLEILSQEIQRVTLLLTNL